MQRIRAECFADRDAPAFALLQINCFRQRRYIVYVGIHVGCGGSIRYITDLQD